MTLFKGEEVTIKGERLLVGNKAPNFNLMTTELSSKTLVDFGDKIKVISVVPSIDTGVCSTQTRTFNEKLSNLENVVVITVSVDLPFAQSRWCGAAGLESAEMLSDYYDHSFGHAYALLMEEWHLLARAVFVLDGKNTIHYAEYLENVHEHPNYEAVQLAVKQLVK